MGWNRGDWQSKHCGLGTLSFALPTLIALLSVVDPFIRLVFPAPYISVRM